VARCSTGRAYGYRCATATIQNKPFDFQKGIYYISQKQQQQQWESYGNATPLKRGVGKGDVEHMEQLTLQGYETAKKEIRDRLNAQVVNFIETGYYLKRVRDSLAYTEDGYGSIYDFAMSEYGIAKSTTDRYININTRFSKGGNSLEIRDEYTGFKRSCLQEMLNMQEEDIGLITADMSVRDIRQIKEVERRDREAEEREKAQNLPIVAMSGEEPAEERKEEPKRDEELRRLIRMYITEHGDDFMNRMVAHLCPQGEGLVRLVNPTSRAVYINKENGQGYIIFYEYEKGVKYRIYKMGRGVEVLDMTYEGFYALIEAECRAMLDARMGKGEDMDRQADTAAAETDSDTELNTEETAKESATQEYKPPQAITDTEVRKSELMEQIHYTVESIRRLEESMKYRLLRLEAKTLLDRLEMLDEVLHG
jgi:hypothetical protein